MKFLITCLITCITMICNAQVNVSSEAGMNLAAKKPVVGVNMGATILKSFSLQTGFLTHISSVKTDGALFHFKMGFLIDVSDYQYVALHAGYQWTLRSTDTKVYNSEDFIYSLHYLQDIAKVEGAQWFVGFNYSYDRLAAITTGLKLHLIAPKNRQYSCR